ncbi:MAG: hypothetical protein OD811_06585 [Alphaproteobacteria bacterium]
MSQVSLACRVTRLRLFAAMLPPASLLTASVLTVLAVSVFGGAKSAYAQQTEWTFAQENRDGQTPGLFAEAWSDNYIERTRALAFFKCDLDEKRGGIVYFVFVPSRRLAAAPPSEQSGEVTLFWRVDGIYGGPLEAELSVLDNARLQYSSSGERIGEIIAQLRRGGEQIIFADPQVPGGGVTDVFSLSGAQEAVSRVQEGCDTFEPRELVFPDTTQGLGLGGEGEDLAEQLDKLRESGESVTEQDGN